MTYREPTNFDSFGRVRYYFRHLDREHIIITSMNERQQAHIDYFLERIEYWKGLRRDYWAARMLAARDADHAHPLRSEEEGAEVFNHLCRLEEVEAAKSCVK
jgi:hypothetical protein